jgi:hypothetical protein
MATSTKALLLALISVVVSPWLVWIEIVALLFADMVTYEPKNPLWVKVAVVVAVVLIAALSFVLPVAALITGKRARSAIAPGEIVAAGARKALASQVVAGVVLALVVAAQAYFVLMAEGICSLDGCSTG